MLGRESAQAENVALILGAGESGEVAAQLLPTPFFVSAVDQALSTREQDRLCYLYKYGLDVDRRPGQKSLGRMALSAPRR